MDCKAQGIKQWKTVSLRDRNKLRKSYNCHTQLPCKIFQVLSQNTGGPVRAQKTIQL